MTPPTRSRARPEVQDQLQHVGDADEAVAVEVLRAVVRIVAGSEALDEQDQVTYTQLVGEIAEEPDYEKALAALK